ncbi:MAG: Hpt domain-containing protein [Spirochaetales bacterium]|nr:Hpt domain-containing protein [Spirochaetales bacterium]
MEKEKSNFGRKMLRLFLTVFLVLFVLAGCILVIFFYIRRINNFVAAIADTSLSRTSAQVSSWVETKRTIINDGEKAIVTFYDSPDLLEEYFAQLLEVNPELSDIYFGTVEPRSDGGFFIDGLGWQPPDEYGWVTRDWYKDAIYKDGLIITSPYRDFIDEDFEKDSGGKFVLSIAKPVYKDGKVIGVISADIFADTLSDIVNNARLTNNSQLYLINSSGLYIIHENESNIARLNFFEEYKELEANRLEVLSRESYFNNRIKGNLYFISIGVENTEWILVGFGRNRDFHNATPAIIALSAGLSILFLLFIFLSVRSWLAYGKLMQAKETIDSHNQELELVIADRTASLKSILDNTGQGFFTFGSEFLVDPDYSRGCLDIFGKEIKGLDVSDLLFSGNSDITSDFKQGFDLFFSKKSKSSIIFDLTEDEAIINEKIVSVEYKEISESKILCVLTDVTLERNIEEKAKIDKENHQRVMKVLNHKHYFAEFLNEAENLFGRLEIFTKKEPDDLEFDEILQEIHTFKGNAGFFGFNDTQDNAHESELTISDSKILQSEVSYHSVLLNMKKAYFKELKIITDTMGESWLEEVSGIIVPRESYYKIVNYVRAKLKNETKLIHYLEHYRKVPFKDIFSRLSFIVAATADKLGKKVAPMQIIGGDIRVVPDRYEPLAEVCIHLVNNMVDHGIEFSFEREAVQKYPVGKIELIISADKNHFTLEFKDDGRGINLKEIEHVALEKGLIKPDKKYSQSEIMDLLFESGFSSRSEASKVSGRGLGLAAVKHEVTKLGGTIEVRSRLGKGTVFEIVIPLKIY